MCTTYFYGVGIRCGSRIVEISKMEPFVIIVNGFQPLTIITKRSILDAAAVLYPSLGMIKPLQKIMKNTNITAQKMKFSIKDFFSKCDQIRSFLRIWSHVLKKSLMENFIFSAVHTATYLKYRTFTVSANDGVLNSCRKLIHTVL